jgi:hypothetical protein
MGKFLVFQFYACGFYKLLMKFEFVYCIQQPGSVLDVVSWLHLKRSMARSGRGVVAASL